MILRLWRRWRIARAQSTLRWCEARLEAFERFPYSSSYMSEQQNREALQNQVNTASAELWFLRVMDGRVPKARVLKG